MEKFIIRIQLYIILKYVLEVVNYGVFFYSDYNTTTVLIPFWLEVIQMPWGVGMRDMLALSIHCQTNNYRGTPWWKKSKSWIEKQMFIIYSIFLKFTINSWRDICLSLLFVYHILGGTENHMRILLLFLISFTAVLLLHVCIRMLQMGVYL